jgi:hypothetical protein
MEEIIIRKYKKEDRSFVRNIAWDTAFIGKPGDTFFSSKEILADFLTLYFTDFEPESCFVAECNGEVVGYLIGAKDTNALNKIFQLKILWRLLIRSIVNGILFKKKERVFIFNCLISFLHQEFKMPDFAKEYPATLHINIDKNWRSLHAGSRLIAVYLDYLVKEKIKGVYLATMSEDAGRFFKKQGFILLHRGNRSYFRHLLHKDIPLYIYGKKLP